MKVNTPPPLPKHEITVHERLDNQAQAICSCGRYRSVIGTPYRVNRLGARHSTNQIEKAAAARAAEAALREAAMAPMSRHDELAQRFDSDPDAVEWAHAKILRLIERAEGFERHSNDSGSLQTAARWHLVAAFMRQTLIGGEGCVVAAFDPRLPEWTRAVRRGGDTG